jgi:hypothetical protein
VTELGGRSQLSPLGKVDTRRRSPTRFVHDPELVCCRRFERSALRKHADVGLEPGINVVASLSCPRTPLLSLVNGQGRAFRRISRSDPPYKLRGVTPGSLDTPR